MNNEGTEFKAVGRVNQLSVLTISAYGVAVKNGFEGTEEEWLASLKGEKGNPAVLTESDKAQMVNEVLAQMPEPDTSAEEWIVIADTTTTEGVNYFQFRNDVNGNPIECKKIIANLILPQSLATKGITISVNDNGSQWSGEIFANNVNDNCLRYFVCVELIPDAIIFEFAENGNNNMNQDIIPGKYLHIAEKDAITFFGICNGWNTTDVFPVGTHIKVWGLKK